MKRGHFLAAQITYLLAGLAALSLVWLAGPLTSRLEPYAIPPLQRIRPEEPAITHFVVSIPFRVTLGAVGVGLFVAITISALRRPRGSAPPRGASLYVVAIAVIIFAYLTALSLPWLVASR